MRTLFEIEIEGGPLNGARRHYKKESTAIREAKKHLTYCEKTGVPETVWVDVFEVTIYEHELKSTRKLIKTYENS